MPSWQMTLRLLMAPRGPVQRCSLQPAQVQLQGLHQLAPAWLTPVWP